VKLSGKLPDKLSGADMERLDAGSHKTNISTVATSLAALAFVLWMASFGGKPESIYSRRADAPASSTNAYAEASGDADGAVPTAIAPAGRTKEIANGAHREGGPGAGAGHPRTGSGGTIG
jgi:hypothetical protein